MADGAIFGKEHLTMYGTLESLLLGDRSTGSAESTSIDIAQGKLWRKHFVYRSVTLQQKPSRSKQEVTPTNNVLFLIKRLRLRGFIHSQRSEINNSLLTMI